MPLQTVPPIKRFDGNLGGLQFVQGGLDRLPAIATAHEVQDVAVIQLSRTLEHALTGQTEPTANLVDDRRVLDLEGREKVEERRGRHAEGDLSRTSKDLVSERPDVHAAPPRRYARTTLRFDVAGPGLNVREVAHAFDGAAMVKGEVSETALFDVGLRGQCGNAWRDGIVRIVFDCWKHIC